MENNKILLEVYIPSIEKEYDMLWIQIILSYIGIRAIEIMWKHYFKWKKLHKSKVKVKNKETSFIL